MSKADCFLDTLRSKGGYVRSDEFVNRKDYIRLLKATDDGELIRIRQGVYAFVDALANTMIDVERLIPRGVLCLYSAFDVYNLSTFIPPAFCIAIDSKRKVRTSNYPSISLYYWKKENLDFGIEERVISGHKIFITDIERTVCDAVKYRNKIGLDICNEVINNYISNNRFNLSRLIEYAVRLRIQRVMERYLEARL